MDTLVATLTDSPWLWMVPVLLLLIMLLGTMLRIARVVLVAALVLIVYSGYLHYTGHRAPPEVRDATQRVENEARGAGGYLKENAARAGRTVRRGVDELGEYLQGVGK